MAYYPGYTVLRTEDCPEPVSYTHLDVYKRQGYNTVRDYGRMRQMRL